MGLNYPKDEGTEWMALKRQVKNAFTSANSRVPYQKIAAGIVRISTSLEILAGAYLRFFYNGGADGIFMGRVLDHGGVDSDGIYIRRNGGGTAFTSTTRASDGYGFTAIWDKPGNVVVSDDAGSEQGLARPWLSHTFADTAELTTPPAGRQATGTTDTTVISTMAHVQHPKMEFWGYVYIQTGGATAEVKFKNISTGATMYAATQADGFMSGNFVVDANWDFGDWHQIDVTVRRASGTGNVGFTLLQLMGRQT
jgi:hypothetical protein